MVSIRHLKFRKIANLIEGAESLVLKDARKRSVIGKWFQWFLEEHLLNLSALHIRPKISC